MSKQPATPQPGPLPQGERETIGARLRGVWRHGTLRAALLGALMLWLCLPPVGWWPLAWIAPVPWLWLARLPVLPGRRPYLALYFAGGLFWTATNHWLRLPHPAILPGWLALSWYLAVFPPLIVGLTRVGMQYGVSMVVGGPLMWVAADQARAYLWTGFSMSTLCHSQFRHPELLQTADIGGEFGVTLLMVLFAAAVARSLPIDGTRRIERRFSFVAAGVLVAVGVYALLPREDVRSDGGQRLKIALLQGSISSEVKHDPEQLPVVYRHYLDLSRRALLLDRDVQLIVWPETMFPDPYFSVADDFTPPDEMDVTADELRRVVGVRFEAGVAKTARELHKPLLLGIASLEYKNPRPQAFNSALLVSAEGKPLGRYDKQHRVLFGEFIPLADWFPWLYTLTPLTGGIEAGKQAERFVVEHVSLAPNICYETALARVIRRQVKELRDRRADPDVLVNLTNDSWFRGSSELDLHLACGVLRAIEMRKPLVIAANTGISAHIDAEGRIVQELPRGAADVLVADVGHFSGRSLYLAVGDVLAWLCLTAAGVLAVLGLRRWRQPKQ